MLTIEPLGIEVRLSDPNLDYQYRLRGDLEGTERTRERARRMSSTLCIPEYIKGIGLAGSCPTHHVFPI